MLHEQLLRQPPLHVHVVSSNRLLGAGSFVMKTGLSEGPSISHPLLSGCVKIEDERRVLSIAQDIIHGASNSWVKLPKQIGLAMAVRHVTGSKQLVVLLNRMGHSSSYDELQAVDTSLATEVLAKVETHGTVIPSNISSGSFVQFAADNNDLNEETIDGKNTTHDATTMVVYQKKVFGSELPPTTARDHSHRRRSLRRSGSV